jgi:sec-independent protein translocase protein TatA
MDIGVPELLIVLVAVLLLFGGKKLPELARSLGKAQNEFKKGLADGESDTKVTDTKPPEAKPADAKPAAAPVETTAQEAPSANPVAPIAATTDQPTD